MTTVVGTLNQIRNEEIVLPGIQRDFVWEEERIARLLDSLLRGYPVGLVLLWETFSDIQYRFFTRDYVKDSPIVYTDNSAKKRIKLVLDGQQRLQSLYIALYGTYAGRCLYFDALSGATSDDMSSDRFLFRFFMPADANDRNDRSTGSFHWVSVSALLKMAAPERMALEKMVAERYDLPEGRLLELQVNLGAFADAFYHDENVLRVSTIDENQPADSEMRKSEADVLEMFFRINRQGTPLSRSDLIFSLLKLNWKEAAVLLPDFLRRINDGNSLGLTTDFVVRCLFAVSDLGGKLDLDLLRHKSNVEKLQTNFGACCAAVEAAVDFVRDECQCENGDLIGSVNVLIPFVYYLYHLPKYRILNADLASARKAFYLLALARPFTRYSESRIGTYIRTQFAPLREKGDTSFPIDGTIDSIRAWEGIRSVAQIAEANVDLTLHVVQGLGQGQVQYAGNAPEIDHIFPRSVLRKQGYREEDVDTLANFWILAQGKNRNKSDMSPSRYFAQVDEHTLRRAAIDPALLRYPRYRHFLAVRGKALTDRVAAFLNLSTQERHRLETQVSEPAGDAAEDEAVKRSAEKAAYGKSWHLDRLKSPDARDLLSELVSLVESAGESGTAHWEQQRYIAWKNGSDFRWAVIHPWQKWMCLTLWGTGLRAGEVTKRLPDTVTVENVTRDPNRGGEANRGVSLKIRHVSDVSGQAAEGLRSVIHHAWSRSNSGR